MSKKNTNVMACGWAVVSDADGKKITSVDKLVKGINRLHSRANNR